MIPKTLLGIFAVALAIPTTLGFIVMSSGDCPVIPLQQNFNLTKYLGLWFSYENFDAPFQYNMMCISALYSLKPDGNIKVVNFGFEQPTIWNWWNKSRVRIVGEASTADPSQPAGLNVNFGGQPDFAENSGANYQILDTDYLNYSLVYSCSKIPYVPLKIEFAWILTRRRGEKPANIDQLKAMLTSYGVETDNFKLVDHSDCSP